MKYCNEVFSRDDWQQDINKLNAALKNYLLITDKWIGIVLV